MIKNEAAKVLEEKLKRLTYGEVAKGMANTKAEVLLELLDSKSIKVGDTAADFLARERTVPLVISAIMEDRIKTKFGKFRAESILFSFGRRFPAALGVYLKLLQDENDEIARNSLLALVMWGDRRVIPSIKKRQLTVKSPERAKKFQLACEAIEKSNLKIFNPYVSISEGMWD